MAGEPSPGERPLPAARSPSRPVSPARCTTGGPAAAQAARRLGQRQRPRGPWKTPAAAGGAGPQGAPTTGWARPP
eukprot:7081061-Lingulodinium_polyedra.AAC.1